MTCQRPSPQAERGVSLLVVLLLLLIMTVIGLAAMRSSILQQRMTSNLVDRNVAFQAAETALRQGEVLAQGFNVDNVPGSGCSAGMCSRPTGTDADRWTDSNFDGWTNVSTGEVSSLAQPPQFFVEYLGMAPTWTGCDLIDEVNRSPLCMAPRYRITSRSRSDDGSRAEVLLQTNYLVQ